MGDLRDSCVASRRKVCGTEKVQQAGRGPTSRASSARPHGRFGSPILRCSRLRRPREPVPYKAAAPNRIPIGRSASRQLGGTRAVVHTPEALVAVPPSRQYPGPVDRLDSCVLELALLAARGAVPTTPS